MRNEDWTIQYDQDANGAAAVRHAMPRGGKSAHAMLFFLYALLVALYLCSTANAKPTQEDVFKSISDNVSESNDSSGMIILFVCGGAGLLIVLFVVGKRQQRDANPQPLNHPGKLLKEIRSNVPLKPLEIKQLRAVAETTTSLKGEPLTSPLVLLLCPSVLAKTVKDRKSRVDRQVVAKMIRRLGQE